uniref:Uncharacterized protein n=1 Tax=Tanacetum cinerariifolium TaxID=118510 RepID=A0A699IEG9_TANCI|nr:hypothetical protein [Tanacetum cinerariifolium]
MRNFLSVEVPTVELIVEYDNGAVDMKGMMDNLEDKIANLEMIFAYLKNKKMLERKENKLNKGKELLIVFGGRGGSYDSMLEQIDIPGILHLQGKLFESRGCLLLACRDDIDSREFTIYEMVKGYSVWTVRYLVNTDEFMTPLRERWLIQSTMWSIGLEERKEDSFLVINLSGKVVKYNIISKTVSQIFDIGSNQMDDDYEFFPLIKMVDSDKCLEYLFRIRGNDDFVMINLSGKVVKYNLISKTNNEIFDIGSNQTDDDDVEFIPPFSVDHNLYKFISSLASV